MTPYRCRVLCFALVLALLVSLVPAGFSAFSANAEEAVLLGKTTMDKVNFRYGTSDGAKIIFQIPNAGYVGTIKSEKVVNNVHWYRVEFQHPSPDNSRYYTGYINADFFTPLSAEEAAAYKMGDTVSTPTPVPVADPVSGVTPTPTPKPAGSNTNTDAPAGTIGVLTSSGVNMRKGPGKNFGVYFQLNRGDQVTVLTIPSVISEQTFYFVRYGDQEGFIMSTYLQVQSSSGNVIITPPPSTPTPSGAPTQTPAGAMGFVKTIKGGVKLRSTPGGTTITTVKRNETLPYLLTPVRKNGYTWYFVQFGSYRGYLRGDCVKEVTAPDTTPTPTPVPAVTPTNATGLVTPTPTAAPATEPTGYLMTNASGVNLRVNAGFTKIYGRVDKGTVLPYYGEPTTVSGVKWYRVYYQKYGFCYVHANYVTLSGPDGTPVTPAPTATPVITPAPTATPAGMTPTPATGLVTPTPTPNPAGEPTGYVKTTASGVNLRKEPNKASMGRVDKGTVLSYYGEPTTVSGVKWYKVYREKLGFVYVHGDFVVLCQIDGSPIAVTATPTPAGVTPTPTPAGMTPTPTPAVTPVAAKPEASYSTLKLGSSGQAVKNLITELQKQGYYTGTVGTRYTTAVETAVKNFQSVNGLTVDGIAGSATQHALFGTVPIGTGDTQNRTFTFYPAEKIDWFTGGINELWARGSNYLVYDVRTGYSWWAHRWAGGNHADVEPLTAADTDILCKIYGVSKASDITEKTHWQRRPCLVTIGTRTFACSLYGVPHNPKGDTIPNNNMTGQVCLHFTNSRTHESNKVDSGHEAAIQEAWLNAPKGHI